MVYGIKETFNGVMCANCGRPISKDGIYMERFCANCGNPLKPDSAKTRDAEIKKEQLRIIETIEENLAIYDIRKILKDVREEL